MFALVAACSSSSSSSGATSPAPLCCTTPAGTLPASACRACTSLGESASGTWCVVGGCADIPSYCADDAGTCYCSTFVDDAGKLPADGKISACH